MAVLWNETQKKEVLKDLRIARTSWKRMKGLLGTRSLSEQEGLWIHACNSVHTFFMNYAIDCIFLDQKMNVKAIVENVQPGRLVWPRWGARSVIEVKGGFAHQQGLKVGDRLNVGN